MTYLKILLMSALFLNACGQTKSNSFESQSCAPAIFLRYLEIAVVDSSNQAIPTATIVLGKYGTMTYDSGKNLFTKSINSGS
jgi:hypothetical protein